MPRPIWRGAITFGLVSVPVNLYTATQRQAELSFRLLHAKDQAPIEYRRVCSAENVEVPWAEIVKGHEYAKGQYVIMTEADFEAARTQAAPAIEIRDFVPAGAIDFAYFESPYWLEPAAAGRTGYALLRRALEQSGRVGIGTLVMRQREHLVALRPAGPALMLTTMRFADEIRNADDLDLPRDTAVRDKELQLALQLVDTLAADWEPSRYHDTYRETLRRAIEQKLEGKEIRLEGPARPGKVVDLVKALQASLASGRRPGAKAAGRARASAAARTSPPSRAASAAPPAPRSGKARRGAGSRRRRPAA